MALIIGGGGAGLYFAIKYKEKNPDTEVVVVEEHTEIGKPIQCTGILTNEIEKLLPLKDVESFTLNKITKTKVYSKHKSFETKISKDRIICNVSFIEYLHKRADKLGVKILSGHKYLDNDGSIVKIRNITNKKIIDIKTNFLIGADGPSSLVAKNNSLYSPRKFLTGVQARIKLKDLDPSKIDFYPNMGEYAWSAPESSEISRVGVAASSNAKKIFDDFIKKYPGTIIEMQGGPIPLHEPRTPVIQTQKNLTVALLGDSALQIKNTTGGGIIPGMKAAIALSEGATAYKKNLRKLNLELYLHYEMNKAFRKYNDKDWDELLSIANTNKTKKILSNTNRDSPIKLLAALSLNNPKLMIQGIKTILK